MNTDLWINVWGHTAGAERPEASIHASRDGAAQEAAAGFPGLAYRETVHVESARGASHIRLARVHNLTPVAVA